MVRISLFKSEISVYYKGEKCNTADEVANLSVIFCFCGLSIWGFKGLNIYFS